jgi:hypothetical protein
LYYLYVPGGKKNMPVSRMSIASTGLFRNSIYTDDATIRQERMFGAIVLKISFSKIATAGP